MKRTVLSLSFLFLLFTLSYARNIVVRDNPTHFHHHHQHHDHHSIKSSSDGGESSTILLPTESSHVHEHTESKPFEVKEATNEDDFDHRKNRISFPVIRFKLRKCRHHQHRYSRYPSKFVGIDEMNFDRNNVDLNLDFPVESKVILHRHVAMNYPGHDQHRNPLHRPRHHHHHHDHDDQTAEMMREIEKDHEYENKEKKLWNKIHKFLGYF
ncbi:hypothetical protein BVRB_5g098960 [Beta vulgaris subsp. vulgaris]|nr:hypothetical protein BVRB_5g098960 [Beta vulgaris subsp. vulgaris]